MFHLRSSGAYRAFTYFLLLSGRLEAYRCGGCIEAGLGCCLSLVAR